VQSPGPAVQTLSSIHALGADLSRPKQSAVSRRILDIFARIVIAWHTTCKPHCWVRRDTRRQKAGNRAYITQALRPCHSATAISIKAKAMGSGCERHSLEFLRFSARLDRVNADRALHCSCFGFDPAQDCAGDLCGFDKGNGCGSTGESSYAGPRERASSSMGLTKPASNERWEFWQL
jgi:hypothetical protein